MTNIIHNNSKNFPNPNKWKINLKGMTPPPVPPKTSKTKLSSQNGLQDVTKPKLASNPNEGKVNSKGMISPPVPPKLHKAKIAVAQSKSLQGILYETDTQAKTNESLNKQFKYEVKLPGIIHTTVRKNHVGNGLNKSNLKKKASSAALEPNVKKKKEATFANPEYYIIPDNVTEHQPTLSEYMMKKEKEVQKLNPFKTLRETMLMYKNVNAFDDSFEQDNHQKSSDLHQAQATDDSIPCLAPQRSEVSSAAGDELENTKFPKTLSKEERKNLDFSPKQQNNQKFEISKKTYNPLNWNPIYQDKKRVSPDRFKIRPLLCSVPKIERKHGFQSDPSVKHIKFDTAVCSITNSNDKKDIRPDISYKQEPSSEVYGAKVKELIKQIEQGSRSC
ncbi:hypothetical protein [Wolbachia pipientis]|uniref:hypothetical protein n=1 Tax=Wolbachia pipientis TaxID=955 RepID=UPI0025A34FE0|nr:hypothetical protein [Wolbachia pipientis]MDM8335455.1 hypothetical protein [Wolbachia pipientis]